MLLQHWFDMGTAQAIRMYTNNAQPIYQFNTGIRLKGQYSYLTKPATQDNRVEIVRNQNQITATSHDPESVWFDIDHKKSTSTTINIPNEYAHRAPLYITWDYQNGTFKRL